MAKIRRMQGFNAKGIEPEDYIYATEVANQKAVTAQDRQMQQKAQKTIQYLEAKYPGIDKKFKLFGDRIQNTEPMKSLNKTPRGKKK